MSRRSIASLLWPLIALSGCESAEMRRTPTGPKVEMPAEPPPSGPVYTAAELSDTSERYIHALEAFQSSDAAEWEKARRELESGKNPYIEPIDKAVLRETANPDPVLAARAREELWKKGRVHRLLRRFNAFDYALWQQTRVELVGLGDYGATQCALALLRQLFLSDASRQPLIRAEIAEIGGRALPAVVAVIRKREAEKGRKDTELRMKATLPRIEQCIRILAEMGPVARRDLEGLAASPETEVRLLLAKAIRDAKDPMGRPIGERLISDPDWPVRAEAAAALGAIGHPDSTPVLLRVLASDPDVTVRKAAALALGSCRSPAAVEPLLDAANRGARSNDPDERHIGALAAAGAVRIARELAKSPGREGARVLERILHESPAPEFRASAAEAIGQVGDVRSAPPLVDALSDPDLRVRQRAIEALGRLHYEPAVDALIAVLERPGAGRPDLDRLTAAYAGQALETITGRNFGTDPVPWKTWRDGGRK